jgi:hypothetical protein
MAIPPKDTALSGTKLNTPMPVEEGDGVLEARISGDWVS